LELANAYACLARLGTWLPWTLREEPGLAGSVPSPAPRVLYSPESCYQVADILADNQARLLTFGPRSVIRLPFPCAVKTGTSTTYRDNWALGYTPEFTVGVWVGNFDNTPMNEVSGVTGAGPIFRDIFDHLHQTRGTTWYARPASLVPVKIDPRNGRQITAQSPAVRITREEWLAPGTLPPPARETDYEPGTGKAYLQPEYASWVAAGQTWLAHQVTLRPPAPEGRPPHISTPLPGAVYYLDPDLPGDGSRLLLEGTPEGLVWTSPTLDIQTDRGQPYAVLREGHHELLATFPGRPETARSNIEVRPPPTAAGVRSRRLSAPAPAPAQPGAPQGQQPEGEEKRPQAAHRASQPQAGDPAVPREDET
jgi:penicillin-binding protein 1C